MEAAHLPHRDVWASSGDFTPGDVTALEGVGDDSRTLRISALVQAGNSGGRLLDGSGNLVGVVSSKLNAVKLADASGDLPPTINLAVKSANLASFSGANRVAYKVRVAGGHAATMTFANHGNLR